MKFNLFKKYDILFFSILYVALKVLIYEETSVALTEIVTIVLS